MTSIDCTRFWGWSVVPKYPLLLLLIKSSISRCKTNWAPLCIRKPLPTNPIVKLRSLLFPIRKRCVFISTTSTDCASNSLNRQFKKCCNLIHAPCGNALTLLKAAFALFSWVGYKAFLLPLACYKYILDQLYLLGCFWRIQSAWLLHFSLTTGMPYPTCNQAFL